MTSAKGSSEIAAHLRREINTGRLTPGSQVPTGAQLRDQFGVANQTVYAAIKLLRAEGLISTRPGIGCFVRDYVPRVRLVRRPIVSSQHASNGTLSQSLTADSDEWLAEVQTSLLVVTAGPELAIELGIAEEEEVLLRVRTMADNGDIVALATSRIPRSITKGTVLENEDTGEGGVFARLKDLGYSADRHIELVTSGLATEDEAVRFQQDQENPSVLRITRQTIGLDNRILGSVHITALADRFELLYDLPVDQSD